MTTQNPQESSPVTAIEKAREVAERYKRQQGYLTTLNTRLPILQGALKYNRKVAKEAAENVTRLELEVAAVVKHIEQLTAWLAKHADLPDDIAQANALADKIERLQKEIERRRKQLERLENGLP